MDQIKPSSGRRRRSVAPWNKSKIRRDDNKKSMKKSIMKKSMKRKDIENSSTNDGYVDSELVGSDRKTVNIQV